MDVSSSDSRTPAYILRHSERERRRLIQQHEMFATFTRQLLVDAGIGPGMRVLDLGAGVGDVSLLVAEIVGSHGAVVGVDKSAESVAMARARAAATGASHVRFVEGDVNSCSLDEEFDATVGRFVLAWLADPLGALRTAVQRTRPGGVVVFQEFDHVFQEPRTWPTAPLFERTFDQCLEALQRSGFELRMGAKLFQIFIEAGLPAPTLRMDVRVGGGNSFPGYAWLAESVRSVLPRMTELGIVTASEIDVDTLADQVREEIVGHNGTMMLAPVVGAWAHAQDLTHLVREIPAAESMTGGTSG